MVSEILDLLGELFSSLYNLFVLFGIIIILILLAFMVVIIAHNNRRETVVIREEKHVHSETETSKDLS